MSIKSGALSVRFTPEDMDVIGKLAEKQSMYASTWVRYLVLRHLKFIGKKKSKGEIREYKR